MDIKSGKDNDGFRASELPASLLPSARKLIEEFDEDGDGVIDTNEFIAAVNALQSSRSSNQQLRRIIIILVIFTFLLIGAMFGVSIAAARLAQDATIDSNGVLHAKHTGSVVSTKEAIQWSDKTLIADMNQQELAHLKTLVFLDGDLKFDVKGYARTTDNTQVILLVEGGTMTWDKGGIVSATGNALDLLVIGFDITESGRKRQLGDMDTQHIVAYNDNEEVPCRRLLAEGKKNGIYRKLCGPGSSINDNLTNPSRPSIAPSRPKPIVSYSQTPYLPCELSVIGSSTRRQLCDM